MDATPQPGQPEDGSATDDSDQEVNVKRAPAFIPDHLNFPQGHSRATSPESDTESETDPESAQDEDDDSHELWTEIKASDSEEDVVLVEEGPGIKNEPADYQQDDFVEVHMGDADNAMEYDQELIFKHL
jgi:DNA ligase 4